MIILIMLLLACVALDLYIMVLIYKHMKKTFISYDDVDDLLLHDLYGQVEKECLSDIPELYEITGNLQRDIRSIRHSLDLIASHTGQRMKQNEENYNDDVSRDFRDDLPFFE